MNGALEMLNIVYEIEYHDIWSTYFVNKATHIMILLQKKLTKFRVNKIANSTFYVIVWLTTGGCM